MIDSFSPPISPVKTGNAFEETIEKIMAFISVGSVLPGEKLPSEREISAMLGVSRTTLREAYTELQNLGILEIRRGRSGGAYVLKTSFPPSEQRALDSQDIKNLIEYRKIIEPAAAEKAATMTLSAEQRNALTEILEAVSNTAFENYRSLDGRLHLYISQLAGIPQLTEQVATIRIQINDLLDQFPLLDTNIRHSHDQHGKIVNSILHGESEDAKKYMEEHIEGTAALIRALID